MADIGERDDGVPGGPAARLCAPDRPLDLRFDAIWKGLRVGAYTFHIAPAEAAGGFSVAHTLTIAVKIGFITAYRYLHKANEVWRDGRLQELTSETDDDGDPLRLRASAQGTDIAVDGPQGRFCVEGGLLTTTCAWHPSFVGAMAILDAAEGRMVPLTTDIVGKRCERIDGRECQVTDVRFAAAKLSGRLSYAEGGFLVSGELERKGHVVRFVPAA